MLTFCVKFTFKHKFCIYVWGAYKKFDFVKWDKSHLRYCKPRIWQLEAN